jgi:hypothetical protein
MNARDITYADYEWLGHYASEADGRMQIIQFGVP